MRKGIAYLLFLVGLSNCANPVNEERAFRSVAGSYLGSILMEEQEILIELHLRPNGFYTIKHGQIANPQAPMIKDDGVYWVNEAKEIDLARRRPGFRYFKWEAGSLKVLDQNKDAYSAGSDTAFYLPLRASLADTIILEKP